VFVTAAGTVLAAHTVLTHGAVLAAGSVTDNEVTPGVLGFLVVAGMGVVLYFLLKSLNKQLRKIPPPPDDEGGEAGQAAPLSPLQAAAARRRAAAAAQKSAAGGPDLPDRLGQSPPAQRR
jgi:hypothetical protein